MLQLHGSIPKISCLLVTAKGRLNYLKQSLRCYGDQTYPNKELVIVNEGPVEYQQQIRELVADRTDVRLIFLDGWYSLGALRNISIALCHGDLFVQWDDDDFNAPERLSIQYSFLASHPEASICYLSDQLHYYFPTKTLFWENWAAFHSGGLKRYGLIPGTGMSWKSRFRGRYPSAGAWCSAGEDSVMAGRLCDENQDEVILLPGMGHLQVYSFHGGNVWDLEHHMRISRDRSMNTVHMIQHRDRIARTLNYLNFDGPTRVMGRDGLAFIHEVQS